VCCVGLWKRKAVTVAAMEKGKKQEHLRWYLLSAAWTIFLTMSGDWNRVPVKPHARGEGMAVSSPQRGIALPPLNSPCLGLFI